MDDLAKDAANKFPPGHAHRRKFIRDFMESIEQRLKESSIPNEIILPLLQQIYAATVNPPIELQQSNKFGDQELLIMYGQDARALLPSDNPHRSLLLSNLGYCLWKRFERLDNMEDLEEAVAILEEATHLLRPDDPQLATPLANLACCLLSRFERLGDTTDLKNAISHHEAAFVVRPVGHPDRHISLNDLGAALWWRYRTFRDPEDLEVAISYHIEALSLRTVGHPHRPSSLTNLAGGYWLRYGAYAKLEDLQKAIDLYEKVLSDRPEDLDNLAVSLRGRYKRLGNIEDLERALSLQLKSLPLRPFRHHDRGTALTNLGLTLYCGFEHTHDIGALDSSISYHREALEYHPVGDWQRPVTLDNLGHALRSRYEYQTQKHDLNEAIALHREAFGLSSAEDARHRRSMMNLGVALVTLCEEENQKNLLDEAVDVLSKASVAYADQETDAFLSQNALASAFWVRYHQFGSTRDFEEAVQKYSIAVLLATNHKDRSTALSHQALSLRERFVKSGNMGDLNQAIEIGHEAFSLCSASPNWQSATAAGSLALSLETKFHESRDIVDLDESTKLRRTVVDLLPTHAQGRHIALCNLSANLRSRFEELSQLDDLKQSIEYAIQAKDLVSEEHPDYSALVGHLASSLAVRYQRVGDTKDLEEAIGLNIVAVRLRPPGHPGRPFSLNNLGAVLFNRFDRFGGVADLADATKYFREARDGFAPFERTRSVCVSNLANALLQLSVHTVGEEYLDEAFLSLKAIVKVTDMNSFGSSSCLNSLGMIYLERYERHGDEEELQNGIDCFKRVLELHHTTDADRYKACTNLGIIMKIHYEMSGDPSDLEFANEYHREACHILPESHTQWPSTLMTLGNTLMTRSERLGIREDLEEAVQVLREALRLLPDDHVLRYKCMNNLGIALQIRYGIYGDEVDLHEAVSSQKLALNLIPVSHSIDRAMGLDNLGNALLMLFVFSNDIVVLMEAIQCRKDALDLRPPGHIDRYMSLYNLGAVFYKLHEHDRKENSLTDAIYFFRQAKGALKSEHPTQSIINVGLAWSLLSKGEENEAAYQLLADATNNRTSTSKMRLDAALKWVEAAETHEHQSTLQAYSMALTLLEYSILVNPTIENQRSFLNQMPKSLACDACAYAIERGDVEQGIRLLEQGRTILWNRLRGYRHSLEELKGTEHGYLVERFESLSGGLERLATNSESNSIPESTTKRLWDQNHSLPLEIQMRKQRLLLEDWDKCVEDIRMVDGHQDFLRASSFQKLQTCAIEGPVIIINVSKARCDGIILQENASPIVVPLSEISQLELSLRTTNEDLERSLVLNKDDLERDAEVLGIGIRELWNSRLNKIQSILRSLWRLVVYPMIQHLNVEEMSRIWWIPTAELTGLPLHAAGPFAKGKKDLPDLYVSSYTPTLSSLILARRGCRNTSTPSFFAVGVPDEKLRHVKDEIEVIKRHAKDLRTLMGDQVTPQTFLDGLQKSSWVHIACHGYWDISKPFQSSFRLPNDMEVSILDLTRQHLRQREFAFLSACFAAVSDSSGTPDEVIHLAAALQFSGFSSVVGTLWELIDKDAPLLAEEFYKYLFRNGRDANVRDTARATNIAVNVLRRQPGMTPNRWVQIIHMGV